MSDDKRGLSTVMNHGDEDEVTLEVVARPQKSTKLRLDKEALNRPAKTRNELYQDMVKKEKGKKIDPDIEGLSFPHPITRGISLLIDAAFAFGCFKVTQVIAPFELGIVQMIMGKYHFQMMFSPEINLMVVTIISFLITTFFLVIIPVTFFHASLGKKLTGIKVRAEFKLSLSLKQIIKRELFYKPLGILLLAGFIMPFFDKKKKSLHDKLCGTIVVTK